VSQAVDQQLAPLEFLALLLDDELERRSQQTSVIDTLPIRMPTTTRLWLISISRRSWDQPHPDPDLASCVFISATRTY